MTRYVCVTCRETFLTCRFDAARSEMVVEETGSVHDSYAYDTPAEAATLVAHAYSQGFTEKLCVAPWEDS